MARLMRRRIRPLRRRPPVPLPLLLLLLSLLFGNGADLPGQGVPAAGTGEATAPDPIAVATAAVLKGQTNAEQRKVIRKHYLTVAAEEAEALLRTQAFEQIIAFVRDNRELFGRIYAALRRARGSLTLLQRSREVVTLQGEVLLLLGVTGERLVRTESFSPAEVRQLREVVEGVMTTVGAELDLLLGVFAGDYATEFSDAERLALLNGVHGRLGQQRQAVRQLQRYLDYLESNRRPVTLRGAQRLFEPYAQ